VQGASGRTMNCDPTPDFTMVRPDARYNLGTVVVGAFHDHVRSERGAGQCGRRPAARVDRRSSDRKISRAKAAIPSWNCWLSSEMQIDDLLGPRTGVIKANEEIRQFFSRYSLEETADYSYPTG